MNRQMKIIFTLSLLLNVTLIGVIGGAAYKRWDNAPPPAMAQTGDPAFNHKMAKAMADARKGQDGLLKDMRAARKELSEVLAADPFDEAAFQAAAEKMRKIQDAMFDARHQATLNMARAMSAAERQQLAAHLEAMGARFGKKREGGPRWEGAPPEKAPSEKAPSEKAPPRE